MSSRSQAPSLGTSAATRRKFDVCDQDLAKKIWAKGRSRWSREQLLEMALLCHSPGKNALTSRALAIAVFTET